MGEERAVYIQLRTETRRTRVYMVALLLMRSYEEPTKKKIGRILRCTIDNNE